MHLIQRAILQFATALILVVSVGTAHGQAAPKYWIFFADKPDGSAVNSISDRALQRRALRGSPVDPAIDRPVSAAYRDRLRSMGVQPLVESRWLNAVSAHLTAEQRMRIESLPFVRSVREVAWRKREIIPEIDESAGDAGKTSLLEFGPSLQQIEQINAVETLERGINGSGVILGFLDTPFRSLSQATDFDHEVFTHIHEDGRLLGVRNFTGKEDDGSTHGFSVVSAAMGFKEGQLIGPGHGASLLAATTEYAPSETNQEEDFFVAGMEWMEEMGADIVSISLGYTTFDPGQRSYTQADLDGDTGLTTRAADRAAALGVVVVAAAGNEGNCISPDQCWYYISTPADGDSVIAVGAVNLSGLRVSFSGRGPTADERIKPDVAALGSSVYLATTAGGYTRSSGTSFAAPLVAGVVAQILQANPLLTPMEVRELFRQTSSLAASPNNDLGWGVVNSAAAVNEAIALATDEQPSPERPEVDAYPTPAIDRVVIDLRGRIAGEAEISVYDLLGRRVLHERSRGIRGSRYALSTSGLAPGVYLYSVSGGDVRATGRLVITR